MVTDVALSLLELEELFGEELSEEDEELVKNHKRKKRVRFSSDPLEDSVDQIAHEGQTKINDNGALRKLLRTTIYIF